MTDHELERKLYAALDHAAPDDFGGVLSRCETRKGSVTPMTSKTHTGRKHYFAWIAAACLALILVGGGLGVQYQQAHAVASVVSLDVNPSIQLSVNKHEKVLVCAPLNDDAKTVLGDMELAGVQLDVAVNAIVGSLLQHGYLDSLSSAILISVEDNDADRAALLRQELTGTVDSALKTASASAAVLSQTVTQDAGLAQLAQANSISTGKAALVSQVIALNSALSFDALAGLSVEELDDLIKTGAPGMPIGKSAAAQAAEEYAGTLTMDSVTCEVDPELDDDPAHYEVELHTAFGEFEYRVDAYTGAILSGQPGLTAGAAGGGTGSSSFIGESAAKSAALAHVGVVESSVKYCNIWLEYDGGRPEHYEVEFAVGSTQYQYEIDLYTGAILEYDREIHSSDAPAVSAPQPSASASGTDIGSDRALSIALNHAGVSQSAATVEKLEQDYDHGRLEYEVEFRAGDTEYEYTIDGATGAVLEHEADQGH